MVLLAPWLEDPVPARAPSAEMHLKLAAVCECPRCAAGEADHNDASHDQSLFSEVRVGSHWLAFEGGTTKCARVLAAFLQTEQLEGSRVLELGAGTALVGLTAAAMGAHVVVSDQQPVLPIVQDNVDANRHAVTGSIRVEPLYWGDAIPPPLRESWDTVIASDLIFAKENIPLLLATIDDLDAPLLMAHIDRFPWEQTFFSGMRQRGFHQTLLRAVEDIQLYRFTRATAQQP